jgi:hypothetical protein
VYERGVRHGRELVAERLREATGDLGRRADRLARGLRMPAAMWAVASPVL